MNAKNPRYPIGVARCFAIHWEPGTFTLPEPFLSAAETFFQHYDAKIERIDGAKSIVNATRLGIEKSRKRTSFAYYSGGEFGPETLLALAWDVCVENNLETGKFFCGTTKYEDPKFVDLIRSIVQLMLDAKVPISVGYSFVRELMYGPAVFPSGIISKTDKDPDDADEIARWGDLRLEGKHLKLLRGINDLQILSPEMCNRKIDGMQLRKWLASGEDRGILEELSDGYFLWRAPSQGREVIRVALCTALLSI